MSSKQSYAEMSAELEAVLARLQHDDIDVDEALEAYKKGMELVGKLEAYLKEAENTITKIKADFS
jgi:exodeoxyribonuclease VII small subunit